MPAAHGAFHGWLNGNPYRVIRLEAALPIERMRSALLARSILGADSLSWLEGPVLSELFGAINPAPMPPTGFEAQLHKIVRQAVAATREYEQKARRAVFAPDPTTPPSAEQLAAVPTPGAQTASTKIATTQAPEPVAPTPSAAAGAAALFQSPAPAPAAPPARQPVPPAHAIESTAATPAPSAATPLAIDAAAIGRNRRDTPDPFAALLGGSRMMSEFFRALAQDVTAGKVKVAWAEKGLVLPKKMIGHYGIASDTLIDNLRKLSLLYGVQGQDLVLAERIGTLIMPRPNTPA
ncbi:hypothetical protein [Cupriavidus necator]